MKPSGWSGLLHPTPSQDICIMYRKDKFMGQAAKVQRSFTIGGLPLLWPTSHFIETRHCPSWKRSDARRAT
ncbi:hypothetical protein ELR57_16575 [Cohnella sp. AR92]|nr:hypothetical protein ELR57_16575 [Cohnella sp. AR92]